MEPLLEWVEPQAVRDYEWARDSAIIKRVQRTGVSTVLILAVPILGFAIWAHAEMGPIIIGLLGTLFYALVATWTLWLSKFRARCELRQDKVCKIRLLGSLGPFKDVNGNAVALKWRVVERYECIDHPALEGVRCLVIHDKWKRYYVLHFAPDEVDEAQIRAIIEEKRI